MPYSSTVLNPYFSGFFTYFRPDSLVFAHLLHIYVTLRATSVLIIYSEVARIMKEKKVFDTYTVKELFAELKKLKITQIKQNQPFLSELSKKQRVIFRAFGIQEEALHSY